MTTTTKKRSYLWMLDCLPALALGQFCSKWLLTVFHGTPVATGWVAAISLVLGGGVGFVLSKFMRTKITENMENRSSAFIVSLSVSFVLALAIVTATVLLTKPREISYEAATAVTLPPTSHDAGASLFKEVIEAGKQCASENTGTQVISCFARASPKKCESTVYAHFADLAGGREYTPAWAYCVASCADAGAWSRNFGECSRELK